MFIFQMEESELTNFQFATLARISNDYPAADFLVEEGADRSIRVTATDTDDQQTRVWRIDWEGDGYQVLEVSAEYRKTALQTVIEAAQNWQSELTDYVIPDQENRGEDENADANRIQVDNIGSAITELRKG